MCVYIYIYIVYKLNYKTIHIAYTWQLTKETAGFHTYNNKPT